MVESLVIMQNEVPLIQPANMMGGLLRALITTGAGLMVAIPCYIAFNLLVIKIDRIVLDMQRATTELVAFFRGLEHGAEENGADDAQAQAE